MNFEDWSKYRIQGHESFYVPDFVTPEEEEYLLRKISETPQQRWKQLANRRLQLWGGEMTSTNTLLTQAMPSFLNVYPDLISRLKTTGIFASSPHGGPNHIILNEYLPGQGIMPHEDGPAYNPVVATISLGSHSVFHYYKYKTTVTQMNSPSHSQGNGQAIEPKPVLSLMLERRSLVISRGPMYTSHLHGIEEISEDCVSAGDPPIITNLGVKVANCDMLTEPEVRRVMKQGGVLKRGIRYSLTCRDVERVSSVKSLIR